MIYTKIFPVRQNDVDFRGRATPGALLRCSQQIAAEHAEHLGITQELYTTTHTAYVLAKLALHIVRAPAAGEALTLQTEPEALRHAVNRRFTAMLDEQGRETACVDSRWVLIDTDRRMILRRHPAAFPSSGWAERVERELPMKLSRMRREDCEALGTQRACYSRCDTNGHMNNTVYADLACDALPLHVWQTGTVQDAVLYYHKEVPLGETTLLYRARKAENVWYVSGWQGDTCNFEAELTMTENP